MTKDEAIEESADHQFSAALDASYPNPPIDYPFDSHRRALEGRIAFTAGWLAAKRSIAQAPTSEAVAEKPQGDRNAASPAAPAFQDGATASGWISVDEQLPPLRKYVVGRYHARNWKDSSDQENVGCVVVKRVMDESGHNPNNRREYQWETFGPSKYFGQDITHWMPLPPPPDASSRPAGSACQGGNTNPESSGIDHAKRAEGATIDTPEFRALVDRHHDEAFSYQAECRDNKQFPEWVALVKYVDGKLEAASRFHAKPGNERAEFEAYMGKHGWFPHLFAKSSDGSYQARELHNLWSVWQARGQQAGGAEGCKHRLADARNPAIESGYMCVDCGAMFAAADHAKRTISGEAG